MWNIQRAGSGWQDTVFVVADRIGSSAFYVAADIWAHKQRSGWGLANIYGAFEDVYSFVEQILIPSPTRCFSNLSVKAALARLILTWRTNFGRWLADSGAMW